jgi:hypothetical protein
MYIIGVAWILGSLVWFWTGNIPMTILWLVAGVFELIVLERKIASKYSGK